MSVTAKRLGDELPFEVKFAHPDADIVRDATGTALRIPLPLLAGDPTECIFPRSFATGESHGFALHNAGQLILGCAVQRIDGPLQDVTRDLYTKLLAASTGRSLYRIWNYVPAINATVAGLENYHAFCAGRSEAFENSYGRDFKRALPAASAVGSDGGSLAVAFVAGPATARHVENSEQVPAYEYPPEHGFRPPCFSRATLATNLGRPLIFISGTAAIKGHATIAPGSLCEQLDCTLDNLRIIGRAAGIGETLGADAGFERHFKVYLRHAADLATARDRLTRDLFRTGDRVSYLRADICRAALNIEIEATLVA
jgi:chorismate lyase/3-hydroxybenzoate synthase